MSFALATIFWLAGRVVFPPATPIGAIVAFLALANLLVGGFNILPCLPLDGGRVLRSVVWGVTARSIRATRIVALVAQTLAAALVGFGVWEAFSGQVFVGLWLTVIGLFFGTLSGRTRQASTISDEFRDMHVADLMDTRPAYADSHMTVEEFVLEHALRGGRVELLVLDAGRLAGIVTVADARAQPREQWSTTPVARIMRRAPIPQLSPGASVSDVLRVLATSQFAQLPVVRDGLVVGMFGRNDVSRFRWSRAQLGLENTNWQADSTQSATEDEAGRHNQVDHVLR